ncbi:hypothetical protein SSBR45G_15160 [Bradyrhizobium sp. SSBR45G]|uniref:DUF5985 family protein n=1 Tax=unclassified Bradyrhizobium TaxID=2631580 RepID=UPI002342B989|nr:MULTISPECIES: DUF5985 family protein [unclassified Bradyrhizobium]GLH76608.1 hypothetical protein SSBR45G_15160 [Bradyrhizobium sp. SSBR45G]GLH84225.1 hypothetical protein SSBR45R_16850 [Bradyrhizobium sp. SSBR45R]
MAHLGPVLGGSVAACSLVVALFFLKFWRRTGDRFFLLFSAAFAVDAGSRFVLAAVAVSDTTEPMYYVPRLVTFGLILTAIVQKNAGRKAHGSSDPD